MSHQENEQENINLIKRCIFNAPLILTTITNENIINEINNILPYSIGIEIECEKNKNYNIDNFKNIPNIIDVNCDNHEQRFRIPNGINGLVCLYNISERLSENCLLNTGSGNHYHVDMTDCFNHINKEFVDNNNDWIIKELETWNYNGNYNSKFTNFIDNVWMRYYEYHKTCEFRIGEMTFNYNLLLKRILHCSEIVKKLKNQLIGDNHLSFIEYNEMNNNIIIDYIKNNNNNLESEILELKKEVEKSKVEIDLDKVRKLLKSRIINI
jgi:hypothetical protein